jgi:hypothetical protein
MAAASRDSDVGLIGICGRKFTRKHTIGVVLALMLVPAGCGGDDEPRARTEATTAPAETATTESQPEEPEAKPPPAETTTQQATTPEDMPGGAGDEEPARTLALFTARGGRITPRVIRVPAFIAVQVELRSADGATYSLRFGDTTITAGAELSSVSTTIDGLRPGERITGRPGGAGNAVRIEATAEPGP